jgi:hypothetical protein
MTKEYVDIVIAELFTLGFDKATTAKGLKRRTFCKYHKGYEIRIEFQKAVENLWDACVMYEIGSDHPIKVFETVWHVHPDIVIKRSEQLNKMFNFLEG